MRYEIFKKAISDKDDKEFHITPVLTFAWKTNIGTKSKGIGLEWGWWALVVGIIYESK